MKKIATIAFMGLLPMSAVYAQQDSTLNRTVVVENEYNPTVMDASKINVLPKVEEPAVVKKGIEYATALRPVGVWNGEEMSPIVREWERGKAKRGYVRAGAGNYGNLDVKAGYVWDITKKDRLNVAASLDGMNGALKDEHDNDWDARFYSSAINVAYRHGFKNVDLHLGGGFQSRVFNYYTPTQIPECFLFYPEGDKQHHTLGDFHVALRSTDEAMPLQFALQTGFQYFKQKYPAVTDENSTEKMVHTIGDVWGNLNEVQRVGIKFKMDNLFYSNNLMKNYTSLELNPYYAINEDSWKLHIGAHVDWITGNESGIDVAPDVHAEYIFSDSYIFYLKAQGGRQVNDYRTLSRISPYWGLWKQLDATYVPLDATLGFKASPVNGLWFNIFGGYQIREQELFCTLLPVIVYAYTDFIQEKGKIGYGGAEVKYGYKDRFDVSLKGTYYSWKVDDYAERLLNMKPEMELNFKANAKVMEGLNIKLGYDYVKRKGDNVDPINNLSIGATYALLKDISIFMDVNNLLNKQYYYENAYPAEKLNILGGLTFRF